MKPLAMYFPEGSREPFPAGAMGSVGKGRVVYLAAGLDAALFSYAFPYQRVMLSRLVRWAAAEDYPIEVKAPMCIQSTFWKQHPQRLIVHLWNGLNTTSDHGLQDVETPLREEAVPIGGIEVSIRNLQVRRARLEPEGIELTPESRGERLVFKLPPVAVHSALVVELP